MRGGDAAGGVVVWRWGRRSPWSEGGGCQAPRMDHQILSLRWGGGTVFFEGVRDFSWNNNNNNNNNLYRNKIRK